MILTCTVLIQIQCVTDEQTDGRKFRARLRRAKHSAVARKIIVAVITTSNAAVKPRE